MFERTTDMVFIMSMDLHLLDVNDVALQLLGYKREELIGASYRKVIVPEEQDDLTQRLANAASSKVRQHIYERTYITKDGQRIPAEVDSAVFRDGHGRILHYQAIGRDIRQRKAAEIELYHQATHDELTGLYNRTLFAEVLWRAIERSKRSNRKAAVLFADLDGFKKINDTFGHSMGDLLLKAVAKRLREIVRTTDTLARLGGDEFGIILEDLNTRSEAQKVADSVQSTLGQPFIIHGETLQIGASCGVSMFPDDETDPDRLLRAADAAMYKLKREKYAAR
ncbi:MAG: GGDEF domain-containing protein [Anaerolineales bacterium]|nr:GGDEF domain-containing protein [Anaerolineales bacterium]